MNGARALLSTLVDAGVDVCFANPGHLGDALRRRARRRAGDARRPLPLRGRRDRGRRRLRARGGTPGGDAAAPRARPRQRVWPTCTTPGGPGRRSSTSWATMRPTTPATTRPLQSDIASIAGAVSGWYRSTARADDVAADAADAVAAAHGPARLRRHPRPAGGRLLVRVVARVRARRGHRTARVSCRPTPSRRWPRRCAAASAPRCSWAASALRADGLQAASRVAATAGAALLGETFPANLERGAGIPAVERLAYLAEMAQAQLDGVRHLVLVDADVAGVLLRLPGQGERPGPRGLHRAHPGPAGRGRGRRRWRRWPTRWARPATAPCPRRRGRPDRPTGAVTTETLAAAVGATLPEGAIVVDEGNTSGLFVPGATAGAPRHDWLTLTGGAIGIGLPMATGAAVAAPDRPVLCLQADGSAMYTLQALWTQAREGLNVTTVVLSNRSYAILNMELHRVGADAGGPLGPPAARPDRSRARLLRPRPGHGRAGPAGRERRGPRGRARRPGSPSPGPPSLRSCSRDGRAWRGQRPTTDAMCRQQYVRTLPNRFQRLYSARNRAVTMDSKRVLSTRSIRGRFLPGRRRCRWRWTAIHPTLMPWTRRSTSCAGIS